MKLLMSALAAATLAQAQYNTTAPLNKPPLESSLSYLEQGLEDNLAKTAYTLSQWTNGQIPEDCFNIANEEGQAPTDYETYEVTYSDCGDPWLFCYHKDSEVTIDSMASQFSQLPIQMRQWVRHVITVPSTDGHAFNSNGNIVFFRPVDDMVNVFVHETGHSLDLLGAYGFQLSDSDDWWNNYNQDPDVPDPYSAADALEDVAQNTVVATFNENVNGGFGTVEPNWGEVFHQYATVITVAAQSGEGNSIITPGENAQCSHRLTNSAPVNADGSATSRVRRDVGDVTLKFAEPIVVSPNAPTGRTNCQLSW
ncbi:MAG: hypothetical protein M1821_009923 [Bathelium mastoideum]|nr:MAG: hypothetical protein M1821_009923 [Bathelium mastoideum]KAI9690305.1 MAG: hypothetical protein M1822_009266 [Bathelium mastoideum]